MCGKRYQSSPLPQNNTHQTTKFSNSQMKDMPDIYTSLSAPNNYRLTTKESQKEPE